MRGFGLPLWILLRRSESAKDTSEPNDQRGLLGESESDYFLIVIDCSTNWSHPITGSIK